MDPMKPENPMSFAALISSIVVEIRCSESCRGNTTFSAFSNLSGYENLLTILEESFPSLSVYKMCHHWHDIALG